MQGRSIEMIPITVPVRRSVMMQVEGMKRTRGGPNLTWVEVSGQTWVLAIQKEI